MQGSGLDIGYKGSLGDNAEPVLPTATGVDVDFPGYDGHNLPFESESQDYVFASHTLEHCPLPKLSLTEWFRVVKTGGHLVVIVPHIFLYEKKFCLPSRFNEDHKTFFDPCVLIGIVTQALGPNTFRLRHMMDNDRGYDYSIPPEKHANGCYEIECVIQKIKPPTWEIK